MPNVKGAVVQAAAIPHDTASGVAKAAALVREAAGQGAQLIVFPEGFLGGYPKMQSFGAVVGYRSEAGRKAYQRYYEASVDLESDILVPLLNACADTCATVVIGIIERDGGTLYCATLTIDGGNGIVSMHRKLMPTGSERLIWGFGDGHTMEVSQTAVGRVGSVICWENYMPMLRMHMYSQGIEFYCAPTADDGDGWVATMTHIALEGRCFVLATCQYLTRDAFGPEEELEDAGEAGSPLLRGGAMIVDPFGQVLAGPDYSGETILYAEMDLSAIPRGKYQFDAVGHYSRPDIFRLAVDTRPRKAVVTSDSFD